MDSTNKTESSLPVGFTGVFNFTNFTDVDFSPRWNGTEYTFPAMSMSPMIIPNETQEGIQNIRKKFARELAIREFYGSAKFKKMNDVQPGQTPALYTDSDLEPFIQRCLEPLPVAQATQKKIPKDKDENYSKSTKVLDKDESLLANGSAIAE